MDVNADKAPEQRQLLESRRYVNIDVLMCDNYTKQMENKYVNPAAYGTQLILLWPCGLYFLRPDRQK